MNRGTKISIVFILFLVVILGVVYYVFKESNEIEDDRYDEKEIRDQNVIDAQKNLMDKYPGKLVSEDADEVFITLPSGTYGNMQQGTIEFLRHDGKSIDVEIPFMLNKLNTVAFPKTSFGQGLYKVRITWTYENKDYLREEDWLLK